jgi:hypothetical protein
MPEMEGGAFVRLSGIAKAAVTVGDGHAAAFVAGLPIFELDEVRRHLERKQLLGGCAKAASHLYFPFSQQLLGVRKTPCSPFTLVLQSHAGGGGSRHLVYQKRTRALI